MAVINFLLGIFNFIPSMHFKYLASGRFFPNPKDMKQIIEYLTKIYPSLKKETLLKQNAALLLVPYLRYFSLDQIKHWEKNCGDHIEILFDLYVAQGFFHIGIRGVKWDEATSSYHNNGELRKIKIFLGVVFIFVLGALIYTGYFLALVLFDTSNVSNAVSVFEGILVCSGLSIALFVYSFGLFRALVVQKAMNNIVKKPFDLIKDKDKDKD